MNRTRLNNFYRQFELFLLCIPAMIIFLLFYYLPMSGLVLAFKDFKPLLGIWGSPWNGLRNFEFFVRSSLIIDVTRNTLLYNGAFIIFTPICSVLTAIFLFEIGKKTYIKIYQSIFFLPYFLSWVTVSIMVYAFLNTERGIINSFLLRLGNEPVSWYSDLRPWPFIIIFMGLWKRVGYNTVIYYAGLVGINPGLYESALIDGANGIQRTLYITIPMLRPLVVVMTILGLGRLLFADFGLHFQVPLQSGPLLPAVDVINYFTYRALIDLRDYGMGTAIGLYQSLVGFLLVILSNWAARRVSGDGKALF